MRKSLSFFLMLLVVMSPIKQVEAKLNSGAVAGIVVAAHVVAIVIAASFDPQVRQSYAKAYAKFKQLVNGDKNIPKELKDTLTTKKSFDALNKGVKESGIANKVDTKNIGRLPAKTVAAIEYETAITNRKWVIEQGKAPRLERGTVTADELSKAIDDHIRNGGSTREVISDLKVEATNFIDKNGKPSLSPKEWMNIAENLGLKARDAESFVNDIGLKLENSGFLAKAEKTSWSSDFKDVLTQRENLNMPKPKLAIEEGEFGWTTNPLLNLNPDEHAKANEYLNNTRTTDLSNPVIDTPMRTAPGGPIIEEPISVPAKPTWGSGYYSDVVL